MPIKKKGGRPISLASDDKRFTVVGGKRPAATGYPTEQIMLRQAVAGVTGGGSAGGDIERRPPETRNPLLNITNFYLPQDQRILSQWIRYYYRFDPYVGNCADLLADIPMSRFDFAGINDEYILHFYEDMSEEIKLYNRLHEIIKEFYLLGEVFPFARFDESIGAFVQMVILNPDYVVVNSYPWAYDETLEEEFSTFEWEPDPELQRIVGSNDPKDMRIAQKIDPQIIQAVMARQTVPIDSFNLAQIANKAHPYDPHGSSILLRSLKDLLYLDKLREAQYCFHPDTEVLTDRGFIPIPQVTKKDKVACFNKENEMMEFQYPTNTIKLDFDGDLYHFKSRRIDVAVTPDHRMLIQGTSTNKEWKVIQAKDVKHTHNFRMSANWVGNEMKEFELCGKKLKIEDFLEFAGYLISEGCLRYEENKNSYCVSISQEPKSVCYTTIHECLNKLNLNFSISKRGSEFYTYSKNLCKALIDIFGKGCRGKRIPNWIKDLSPKLLKILLDALVAGDASTRKRGNDINYISYSSCNTKLADDVMEVVLKCGYSPTLSVWQSTTNGKTINMYSVGWSEDKIVSAGFRKDKRYGKEGIYKIPYKGKVYCLTVPTGFFVVRRNGKVCIQGNCIADRHIVPLWVFKLGKVDKDIIFGEEYFSAFRQLLIDGSHDPDFCLVGPDILEIEIHGSTGKLLNIIAEFEFIQKRILVGMMSNEAMTTGTGVTYNNSSVAMRVFNARSLTVREKMENYTDHKLFRPVARRQGFYRITDAELSHRIRPSVDSRQLITPKYNWHEKINLLDDSQLKQQLIQMRQQANLPWHVLAQAFNIDIEELKTWMKEEENTVLDGVYQEVRKKRASEELMIMVQQMKDKAKIGGGGKSSGLGEGGIELGGGEEIGVPMAVGEGAEETAPPPVGASRKSGSGDVMNSEMIERLEREGKIIVVDRSLTKRIFEEDKGELGGYRRPIKIVTKSGKETLL